jgi:hypothetical protein
LKRQEALFNQHWIAAQARATAAIATADLAVAEANRAQATAQVDLGAATVERIKTLIAYSQIVALFDGVVAPWRLWAISRGDGDLDVGSRPCHREWLQPGAHRRAIFSPSSVPTLRRCGRGPAWRRLRPHQCARKLRA